MFEIQNIISFIQSLLTWVIPGLFAITVHEAAHGFVANQLGDNTAKIMGRITLDPIKHIDIIGTILVPGLLYFSSGFIFGWAKPVPVNFNALNKPKQDMLWVAIAGPAANFIMAIFWALLLVIAININSQFLADMAQAGVIINLILGVLNLLPIPPLDGAKVLSSLLPREFAYYFNKIEPYGFFILLGFIFLGVFQSIILPIVIDIQRFLYQLFNIF